MEAKITTVVTKTKRYGRTTQHTQYHISGGSQNNKYLTCGNRFKSITGVKKWLLSIGYDKVTTGKKETTTYNN